MLYVLIDPNAIVLTELQLYKVKIFVCIFSFTCIISIIY